jgi:hypothetical protein
VPTLDGVSGGFERISHRDCGSRVCRVDEYLRDPVATPRTGGGSKFFDYGHDRECAAGSAVTAEVVIEPEFGDLLVAEALKKVDACVGVARYPTWSAIAEAADIIDEHDMCGGKGGFRAHWIASVHDPSSPAR